MAKRLLQSAKIGDLILQNRFVLAPMTRSRSDTTGVPTDIMTTYYQQRSSAGLLITEGTFVSEQAQGFLNAPGIFNEKQVEGWKKVVAGVKQRNPKTVFYLQLWHTGRSSHPSLQPNGQLPIAPSPIAIQGDHVHTPSGKQPYVTPREMTLEDIERTVEEFGNAAAYAKAAGFDGVEIHGANGYLVDEFLQSATNKRTDKYGGSIENQFRFLDEVITAVRKSYPAERIAVRLSPNGVFNGMGSPEYRELYTYVAKELNGKLGTIHLMDGLGFGFHKLGEPITARDIRDVFDGTLICNVGYTFETAEQRLADGDTDLIAFGRPWISTPDLVERYESGAPLNEAAPMTAWYSPSGSVGYTDFKDLRSQDN